MKRSLSGKASDELGLRDDITGGLGSDWLAGGGGDDTFFYSTGDGSVSLSEADVISDFEDGFDLIDVSGTTANNIGDVTITANGGDAAIAVGGETLAVLTGILNTDLDGTDFIFV